MDEIKGIAKFSVIALISTLFVVLFMEFQHYEDINRQVGLLTRCTTAMLVDQFQYQDDMSPYSTGGSKSSTYLTYLQFLRTKGLAPLADELASGYSYGITPTNYLVAFLDEDKLENQIQDFVDNYWVDFTKQSIPLSDIIRDVEITVDLEGPRALPLSEISQQYFGYGGAMQSGAQLYDFNRDTIIDYTVNVKVEYEVTTINGLTKDYLSTNFGTELWIKAESGYEMRYTMYN